MGQLGFSKKFVVIVVCLVIIGGYFFGYRSVHSTADSRKTKTAQTAVAPAPKANMTAEERSKLAVAWKQAVTATPPDGNFDIAVYDNATGATTHYSNAGATTTYNTASIIKMSILETLLWQDQQRGLSGLTSSQLSEAEPMIENSDNDAATDLWNLEGGQTAVQTFFNKIGASSSTANAAWGLTQTTALDQIKIVNEVAFPGKLLTVASANQADQLLNQVEATSTGVSAEAYRQAWLCS